MSEGSSSSMRIPHGLPLVSNDDDGHEEGVNEGPVRHPNGLP